MPTINIIQVVQGCKVTMAKYWSIKMIFNYQISIRLQLRRMLSQSEYISSVYVGQVLRQQEFLEYPSDIRTS